MPIEQSINIDILVDLKIAEFYLSDMIAKK